MTIIVKVKYLKKDDFKWPNLTIEETYNFRNRYSDSIVEQALEMLKDRGIEKAEIKSFSVEEI